MKTAIITCIGVALAGTVVIAEEAARPSSSEAAGYPVRALIATEAGGTNGKADAPPTVAVFTDAISRSGVGVPVGDPSVAVANTLGIDDSSNSSSGSARTASIAWRPLLAQSLATLAFQHAVRAGFEDGVWHTTLEGPFWDDYFKSVNGLCCWGDGDRNTTNWLFHPILGSAAAFTFANHHRDSQLTPVGNNRRYVTVKGKQMLYATAYSTYFELGPLLSETAIGNVGLGKSQQTYLDLVVTPVLGTAFSIGEDLLRVYVIDKVNRRNHFWGATLAITLNPTRTFVNLFALKVPWSDPEWLAIRREGRSKNP